ncbi:MAG: flavin reductase [Treponematales bacterium]
MDLQALRNLTYGLFVVGTKDGGRLTGCVVNSAGQVGSEPPLVSVCINRGNFTSECVRKAGGFAVSILAEGCAFPVIGRFGFRSGRDFDKFDGVPHSLTPAGYPVLEEGTCGWLECALETSLDLPTHTLFVGRLTGGASAPGMPMTYDYYHRVVKGKTPPSAPSFEKAGAGV